MHTPYEHRLKHKADFRVKYKYRSVENGGRKHPPVQGLRCDFWYHHPDNKENSLFMIWPEFEDENKNVILESDQQIKNEGTARMWIIMNGMRPYHQSRIT